MSRMRPKWIICLLSCLAVIDLGRCGSQSTARGDVADATKPVDKFRILGVFGHPGKSHFDVFVPLLEELARRGHEVTVVSFFPRKEPIKNYRDVSLANSSADIFLNIVDLNQVKHSRFGVFFELAILRHWGLENCKNGLHHPNVQKLLKENLKFDLVLTEGFNSDCFLGFVHRFKAPFISMSSHQLMPWVNQRLSNEDNPSYVPATFHPFPPSMTFIQRLGNAVTLPIIKLIYELTYNRPTQTIVESVFGPGVPPLREIAMNTSLVLVNTHYSLHGAKPNLPNVIEVGGIHISTKKEPLPRDLQRFLDDAREGVLYFSLGSMIRANSMPKEKLDLLLKVISGIPRKVIWKWESEDLENKPNNLLIRKWLPQAAILRHPNVKCYMAHGGLLGISEGVHAGVPMIVIPMYGDQFHNAAAARARGVAVVLEWTDFTEDNLRTALDRVFNDTSFGVNARALSRAYKDREKSPLETAVWWTEYIARGNGIPYLRSAAQDLTWYQYYLLDVIFFVTAIILGSLYVAQRLLRFFIDRRNRRSVSLNGKISSSKKKE